MNRTSRGVWFASLALVASSGAWASDALAQSVSLQDSSISRSTGFRSSTLNPTWISRADCLADDVISFPLTVSNYANYQLEVWVGGASNDCTAVDARTGASPTCWKVWQGVPTSTNVTALVHVRDIVAQNKETDSPNGPGSGTIEDCTPASDGTTAPQAVTLYFMLVDATSQQQVGGVSWSTKFDLVGPTPPDSLSAGVGDTILVLNWGQSNDTDLVRYNFYCDPVPGKETVTTSLHPMDLDGGVDATWDASSDGGTETDASSSSTDASTNDAPASTSDSDAGSSSSSSDCPTNLLVAGQFPDDALLCGSGSGTKGTVSGLTNGITYSVAVAAVDGVGNVGKLSNVSCATPQPVDDFFSVYRQAGGQAGGGFCAIVGGVGSRESTHGLLWTALCFAGVASVVARRRRRI